MPDRLETRKVMKRTDGLAKEWRNDRNHLSGRKGQAPKIVRLHFVREEVIAV